MALRECVALAALAAASAFCALPPSAEAKQCIWNKGGFVLEVHWYRPVDLVFWAPPGRHSAQINPWRDTPPVRKDNFPVAQGRCNESNEVLTAVVYVVSSGINYKPIFLPDTLLGRTEEQHKPFDPENPSHEPPTRRHWVEKVSCTAPACPVEWGPLVRELNHPIFRGERHSPNNAGPILYVYLIATPPTTKYLDIGGTTVTPNFSYGGPIR